MSNSCVVYLFMEQIFFFWGGGGEEGEGGGGGEGEVVGDSVK